jgi:hypothetical protein
LLYLKDPAFSIVVKMLSGHRQPETAASIFPSQKFSEIFLKPAPLQPMPDRVMVAQVWNHKLNE